MIPALALIGALFTPELPAAMPAAATACVEAAVAADLPTTADRFLPGPCGHTGPPPNRFAYQTAAGMTLAGDAGPDGEQVQLGDGARPVQRKRLVGGKWTATHRLTYDGTRLASEAIRVGDAACLDQTDVTHHYGVFGRPARIERAHTPCKGEAKTTTTTLEWQPDGTALVDGARRRATGMVGAQWFSAECAGDACTCEVRTYDAHHNLLRTRARDAAGALTEIRYDFSCWPKKAAETGPQAGDAGRGKALYATFCETCHGPKGYGDGPASAGLKVRNLASMGDAMCGQTNAILHTIKHGVGTMPAFPMVTDAQARDLVAYIRALQRTR
jgi:mono/diheme cytochrome c family protein